MPQGEFLWKVNVVSRSKDRNIEITGSRGPNPFLNTLTYDVKFPDAAIK